LGECRTNSASGLITDFLTVTPWLTTSGGSWDEACEYRMFTSTWSMFGSVVMSKLTRRFISLPLVWLVEFM